LFLILDDLLGSGAVEHNTGDSGAVAFFALLIICALAEEGILVLGFLILDFKTTGQVHLLLLF